MKKIHWPPKQDDFKDIILHKTDLNLIRRGANIRWRGNKI